MATIPKRLMRKQTDLTRLADQYRKSVEGLTGEYESSFANYQKSAAEQLVPYEAAVKKYKEQDMPAYESSAASYQKTLDAYNNALRAYENKDVADWAELRVIRKYRSGDDVQVDVPDWVTTTTGSRATPSGESIAGARSFAGISSYGVPTKKEGGKYYVGKFAENPGSFTQKAPAAPKAPERPAVADFDSKQFEQKRGQLQQDYTREVGERKGSRLNAVRRTNRTLMRDA